MGQKRVTPRSDNPLCRHDVTKEAELQHVSMSWWMSQPVQAYLDAQTCVRANWERLDCELKKDRKGKAPECKATE